MPDIGARSAAFELIPGKQRKKDDGKDKSRAGQQIWYMSKHLSEL
jgi:hypothetical protein